jgi:hypothetical protein
MDDATREKFYAPGGDEWGDDGVEYELEPPDEEVLALEKRRAREDIVASELAIDVDEIYREMDGRAKLDFSGERGQFRFQFQVKHLLIATAVLAVILTLVRIEIFGGLAALVTLAVAGGALAYFELQQQHRWKEAQRRFQEKYERRRQFFERRAHASPSSSSSSKEEVTIYDDLSFGGSPGYAEWNADAPPTPAKPFRFQFSLQQMLIATTMAAVLFALIHLVGGPRNAASMLGMIALVGLVAHALGADPPEIVVLGWWMVLVLYIVLSLGVAISSGLA